jgi:hypothetical protein
VDFIPPITERNRQYTMNTMIDEEVESRKWTLSPLDRCDVCSAEALVQVNGISGNLIFCGHHYNKIMDNAEGYKKMMSFALTIVDEREKLVKE